MFLVQFFRVLIHPSRKNQTCFVFNGSIILYKNVSKERNWNFFPVPIIFLSGNKNFSSFRRTQMLLLKWWIANGTDKRFQESTVAGNKKKGSLENYVAVET